MCDPTWKVYFNSGLEPAEGATTRSRSQQAAFAETRYSPARHFRWLCRDHWPGDNLLTYHNFDLARQIVYISARLGWAYERALGRAPREEESVVLATLLRKHEAEYGADPGAARRLVQAGLAPVAADLDLTELAGWTSVGRTILNLPEVITRP